MSQSNESRIPRRSFLVGAAGLVGSALVGLSPVAALGRAFKTQIKPPVIAFWTGKGLVAPDKLAADVPMDVALISIQGFGGVGSVTALNVNFNIETASGEEMAPMYAWTAMANCPTPISRFKAPVDPVKGLSLTIIQGPKGANSTTIQLGGSSSSQLVEGTYVITDGAVSLTTFAVDKKNSASPLSTQSGAAANIPYVLLVIERA